MAKTRRKISAFGVDVQNDFCVPDGTLSYKTGQLYVPGAYESIKRMQKFMPKVINVVTQWWFSLDQHHPFDIGHYTFWKDKKGNHPKLSISNPAMPISAAQIEAREWGPSRPELYNYALDYARTLEANGRYCVMVWNEHCIIGESGSLFVPEIAQEIRNWEYHNKANVVTVIKGTNPLTEHYSALEAEVPYPSDPTTHLQTDMIQLMQDSDEIWWMGQALDFCVNSTMQTAFKLFDAETLKRNIIFSDLTDAIFPDKGQQILEDLKKIGVKVTTTTDYLAA